MKRTIAWPLLALAALNYCAPAMSASDAQGAKRLTSAEIQKALSGKIIVYSPAGWADADVSEEYHTDGTWGGILYSVGPTPFSGRWFVANDQVCVVAERGVAQRWHDGQYCRDLWRERTTGHLRMTYLADRPDSSQKMGQQTLRVSDLPPQIPPRR